MPRAKNEQLMEPDNIRKIGEAISGSHWQADVARDLRASKSLITRGLNGSRSPDEYFFFNLRDVMITRIDTLGKLLRTEGLPGAEDQETLQAQEHIRAAIKLLRSRTNALRRALP